MIILLVLFLSIVELIGFVALKGALDIYEY